MAQPVNNVGIIFRHTVVINTIHLHVFYTRGVTLYLVMASIYCTVQWPPIFNNNSYNV